MKQKRIRNHTPELIAEIDRIVALKKQLPRYADIGRAFNVSEQTVRRLVFERMPTLRTKVLFHDEQRTNVRRVPMSPEELDRLASQLMHDGRAR